MRISSPLACLRTIIVKIIKQKRGLKPTTTYSVKYVVAGFSPRFFFSLEVDARVDDKPSRSSRSSNTAERVSAVDIGRRISKIRMVQHVDRVQPKFELFVFVQPETLDEIHIEIEALWTFHRCQAERTDFAWLRIH